MSWTDLIGRKAVEIVIKYEKQQGRKPEDFSRQKVGYDVCSISDIEKRFIEVKGVSESWKTYTWQSLHRTEVECLKRYPKNFFLYIIYFEIKKENRTDTIFETAPHRMYVIPGMDLLEKFTIKEASYGLSPISKKKLEIYRQTV